MKRRCYEINILFSGYLTDRIPAWFFLKKKNDNSNFFFLFFKYPGISKKACIKKMSLTSLVVAAKATHTATVVWVHGLGKEKRMLVLLHMLIIVYKAIVVQVGHSWLMSFLISSHM